MTSGQILLICSRYALLVKFWYSGSRHISQWYFVHSSYYVCFWSSLTLIHLTSPSGPLEHLCGNSQKSMQFRTTGFTSIRKLPWALQLGQHISSYLTPEFLMALLPLFIILPFKARYLIAYALMACGFPSRVWPCSLRSSIRSSSFSRMSPLPCI